MIELDDLKNTRPNQLKPGRDLDILIAGNIMGWTWDDQTARSSIGSRFARHLNTRHLDPWWWVPEYSIRIQDAWDVVYKMKEKGYWFKLSHGNDVDTWSGLFQKTSNPYTIWFSIGESASHAICLAALDMAMHG